MINAYIIQICVVKICIVVLVTSCCRSECQKKGVFKERHGRAVILTSPNLKSTDKQSPLRAEAPPLCLPLSTLTWWCSYLDNVMLYFQAPALD